MMAKPTPFSARPSANFEGLERSPPGRRESASHVAAATGANRITNAELIDWNQVVGTSKPPICRSVKSRAKRLSDVGACSNADQNTAAATKSTAITPTRFFSSEFNPPAANKYRKYTAAVATSTYVML